MKQVTSSGSTKKFAEIADISKWPVSTTGTAFEPGTHYNLGLLPNTPLSYTLASQATGAEWSFCFEKGTVPPEITHPAGVKVPEEFELKESQHVEVNILQIGTTNRWLAWRAWPLSS